MDGVKTAAVYNLACMVFCNNAINEIIKHIAQQSEKTITTTFMQEGFFLNKQSLLEADEHLTALKQKNTPTLILFNPKSIKATYVKDLISQNKYITPIPYESEDAASINHIDYVIPIEDQKFETPIYAYSIKIEIEEDGSTNLYLYIYDVLIDEDEDSWVLNQK